MSATDRRKVLPTWPTIRESIHGLAVLPAWLLRATDGPAVHAAFAQTIPEFASGAVGLQDCRVKHLRLSEDGTSWTGTYHCVIDDPRSEKPHTVLLLGRLFPPGQPARHPAAIQSGFGSEGWCWYVPELHLAFEMHPPETQLPILSELTDPEQARTLLEQSLTIRDRGLHITSCQPQVLRYHPGLRCTLGYHLMYSSPVDADLPRFVIAKTYDGDKGQVAYESMKALWASPLRASGIVTIAQPLAYIPERRLLVQEPIPEEQTLQARIGAVLQSPTANAMADLDHYLRKTARGLAALHMSGVTLGCVHRWEDELTEVRAFVQRLCSAVPELAPDTAALFTYLETLANASASDARVPSHGTFRPPQVLLARGEVGFIDFDSFCQAEPAMDLALFMVSLIDSGMSTAYREEPVGSDDDRLTRLEAIAERFLAYYTLFRPVSPERVALWKALNILELVARSWERVKPRRLNHTMLMLERHLRTLFT